MDEKKSTFEKVKDMLGWVSLGVSQYTPMSEKEIVEVTKIKDTGADSEKEYISREAVLEGLKEIIYGK